MPSRFSIAGHGVQRARENYVCCTHSNLRIYKLVKLNVCLPSLQPWSYLPVCVYLRVQHRTDLVFHGAGWRWGDADSLHDLLHLLEHLSCPVDNLGCSSRHKILIRVHPICSLGYLHIPSALLKATSCTDRLHVMDPVGYLRLDFPQLRNNNGIMSWLVKGRRSPLRTTLTAISLTTGCFGFACVMNRYTESRSYVALLHYSS